MAARCRHFLLLLAMTAPVDALQPVRPDRLQIRASDNRIIASLPLPVGGRFCLHWNHSVTGGKVADCFTNHRGVLTLTTSFLHDYAAGLGDLPGRGTVRAVADGYVIDNIDEALPRGLPLRIAAPRVAQELRGDFGWIALSHLGAQGDRITLHLDLDPPRRWSDDPKNK